MEQSTLIVEKRDDADVSVAFFHPSKLEQLNIFIGDILEFDANGKTVPAIALSDENIPPNGIGLNGTIMNNLEATLGSLVGYRVPECPPYATSVTIRSLDSTTKSEDELGEILDSFFRDTYRPLLKDFKFPVADFDFQVEECDPDSTVVVSPQTKNYRKEIQW